MTRRKALALAAFTVWPYVYILLFLFLMIAAMVYLDSIEGIQQEYAGEFVREWLACILLPLCMLTMLDVLALEAFYLVFLFKTDRVARDKKALWAVALLVGSFLAMLLFWTIHIWSRLDVPSQEDSG